jgi:hypothetical protein
VAIGDPQAPLATFLAILERHGLLADDGWLRRDVRLVSIGDHFDWGRPEDRERASGDGAALLAWLAAHPPVQLVVIAGNHDLSRVGELVSFNDETWHAARAQADAVAAAGGTGSAAESSFLRQYPMLPSAEICFRDFSTYTTEQRSLVRHLLLERRFSLAYAPAPDLLLTHAGVTIEDLQRAGLAAPERNDAIAAADALNRALYDAVARWAHTGGALAIPGLHTPGSAELGEAGGILFHRPSHPGTSAPQAFVGPLHRRFDPRRIPRGWTQAFGHIRDGKCRTLLGPWTDGEVAIDGPLRSLVVHEETIRYARGIARTTRPEDALLIFLDGGMLHARKDEYELLDLTTRQRFVPPRRASPEA